MTQAEKSGFCDGLLGRDCQSPDNWRDAPKYLAGYMAGQESRNKWNLTKEEKK